MSKRQFPYYSAVDEFHLEKRRSVAGINHPGVQRDAPRVFEARPLSQVRLASAGHPFTAYSAGRRAEGCAARAYMEGCVQAVSWRRGTEAACGVQGPESGGAPLGTDFTTWTEDQIKVSETPPTRQDAAAGSAEGCSTFQFVSCMAHEWPHGMEVCVYAGIFGAAG